MYVSAGLKGREPSQESRSCGLSTRERGSSDGDAPPAFTLVDRGSDAQCALSTKSADGPTVRLLLADHSEESLAAYLVGFRAYDPFDELYGKPGGEALKHALDAAL